MPRSRSLSSTRSPAAAASASPPASPSHSPPSRRSPIETQSPSSGRRHQQHEQQQPPRAFSSFPPQGSASAVSSTSPAFPSPARQRRASPPREGLPAYLMSPLARALQAQWRQLQQDMLSPSSLHIDHQQRRHSAERDVLQVLSSLGESADVAVEDAAHVVPLLLAFAVAPLPSLATQVVALAALRGVLSSLPRVHGTDATRDYVEDVLLGEHEGLQALCLGALVAYDEAKAVETEEEEGAVQAARYSSGAATSALSGMQGKARGGTRSLLSKNSSSTVTTTTTTTTIGTAATGSGRGAVGGPSPHSSQHAVGRMQESGSAHGGSSAGERSGDVHGAQSRRRALHRRVTHLSLTLLSDAAALCPSVANALLGCDALLKSCLQSLTVFASRSDSRSVASAPECDDGAFAVRRNAEDVVRLLSTLLLSESEQHNEAALVLCSLHAPHAVFDVAQSLAYSTFSAQGAVRDASTPDAAAPQHAAEVLLWSALKVLGWLTRGCPSGTRHFAQEHPSLPLFLYQALTVPVAQVREAAALWLAALLEVQPQASLQLVTDLLKVVPSAPAGAVGPVSAQLGGFPTSVMGALAEMLRWRGEEMRVYGVSAALAWRWMLLSEPSSIAAVLQRDSSLLATFIELILRGVPPSPAAADGGSLGTEEQHKGGQDSQRANGRTSLLRGDSRRGGGGGQAYSSTLPLPTRLLALESAHVLTLSYALGSLETRARLAARLAPDGTLSTATLRRLRHTAQLVIERTEPSYYDDFPAMEVTLAEPELSAAMQRAGATVVVEVGTPSGQQGAGATSGTRGGDANANGGVVVASRAVATSMLVRLTNGAQWRQLILESLYALVGADDIPANATALVKLTRSSSPQSVASRGSRSSRQLHQRASLSVSYPLTLDVNASAMAAAESVAPIRVLPVTPRSKARAASLLNASALAQSSGSRVRLTEEEMKADAAGQYDEEERDSDGEHRVDFHALMAAALADDPADAVAAHSSPFVAPRTIREVTLLPTSQSATSRRFGVVQRAENLGGLFIQDSMRTVLQLAQHYATAASAAAAAPAVSSQLTRAAKEGGGTNRRASLARGRANVRHVDASLALTAPSLRGNSPSAVFGSAPRFGADGVHRTQKERNPFAPVVKATHPNRTWTVQELQREDVLLFLMRYTNLMSELPQAVAAVEDHLYYLRRQLQLCPTRDVRRRCVLNDLYANVYPTMHLFLRYIDQQARRSRGVLQLLSGLNGGTIHSGNVLEVYDAVGQCTGMELAE